MNFQVERKTGQLENHKFAFGKVLSLYKSFKLFLIFVRFVGWYGRGKLNKIRKSNIIYAK